ncbi:hypothetical protein HDU83_008044 [Entophlyctis luteolus]|nr:hypothetical protein HDU83_008044 [Entophlyctis luteolus]
MASASASGDFWGDDVDDLGAERIVIAQGHALAGNSCRWIGHDGRVSENIANPWVFRGAGSTSHPVRILSFTNKSYMSNSIQDRYHARVDDDEPTGAEFLLDTPKIRNVNVAIRDIEGNIVNKTEAIYEDPLLKLEPWKRSLAEKFNLTEIAKLPLVRLSNGQLMRLRLAKSLLFSDASEAKYLILDEPFTGLDTKTRSEFASLLGSLSSDPTFPKLMLLMRPQDPLPAWITNVLELDQMSVVFQGTHEDYTSRRSARKQEDTVGSKKPTKLISTPPPRKNVLPIVSLENVNVVAMDGGKILDDISWQIYPGERWALTGPNGSGKTTLLAMLLGDHPQAYSNRVRLFGHQRGEDGVSIWDIKERIGFVSPEFHMHFTARLQRGHVVADEGRPAVTLFDAVCTGFGSGQNAVLRLTPSQKNAAEKILDEFGMRGREKVEFSTLSVGEQRLGLIMRALVKRPELVIMDEPFQGVDEDAVAMVHAWMEREFCGDQQQQALVFVAHHEEEMPSFVNRAIVMDGQEVMSSTALEEPVFAQGFPYGIDLVPGKASIFFGCKLTDNAPFCDGTHRKEKGLKKYNEFLLKKNSELQGELQKAKSGGSILRDFNIVGVSVGNNLAKKESDWIAHTKPDGKVYYYNKVTQQSTWDKPDDLKTPLEKALSACPWKEYKTEDGRKYYSNSVTKETVWKVPSDYQAIIDAFDVPVAPVTAPDIIHHPLPMIPSVAVAAVTHPQAAVVSVNFDTKEEAEAAFKDMLEEANVGLDWSWDQTMRHVINKPMYRSLKSLAERKQAFQDYVTEKKKRIKVVPGYVETDVLTSFDLFQEAEEEKLNYERETFINLLGSLGEDLNVLLKYKKMKDVFGEDPGFQSIEESRRIELFDEFMTEFRRKDAVSPAFLTNELSFYF